MLHTASPAVAQQTKNNNNKCPSISRRPTEQVEQQVEGKVYVYRQRKETKKNACTGP